MNPMWNNVLIGAIYIVLSFVAWGVIRVGLSPIKVKIGRNLPALSRGLYWLFVGMPCRLLHVGLVLVAVLSAPFGIGYILWALWGL